MRRAADVPTLPVRAAWALALSGALSALPAAGCGQPETAGYSSTLLGPMNPGDGYSVLRAADFDHAIEHVGVSGDYLFFTMAWHGLYAMPKYGGDVIPIDTDTTAEDVGLAASPTDVVWIKAHFDSNDVPNEQLRRRASGGAGITTLKEGNLHAVGSSTIKNLQLGATQLFMLGEGFVEATPLLGGPSSRVTFPWDSAAPNGLASFQADDAALYLTTCPLASVCYTDCGVLAAPCSLAQVDPATGNSIDLGAVPAGTVAVALDGESLYLATSARLWKRGRLDGAEVELFAADPQGGLLSAPVAVDADHVYLVAYGAPTGGAPAVSVLAIPKAPGPAAVIGADSRLSHGVWEVAVDDQFVFALASYAAPGEGNQVLAFPKALPASP